MIEAAPIPVTTVMRALADPTRRAVFERIVRERGDQRRRADARQRRDARRDLAASESLKQAGLVAERAEGRNVFYRAAPQGTRTAGLDWMDHYGVFWRERFAEPAWPPQGNRSMSAAALKAETQDIVIDEVLPSRAGDDLEGPDQRQLIARWLMPPSGFEAVEGNPSPSDQAGGAWDGVIHCAVLEVMPNERLVYAWRGGDEAQYGLRRAARHRRHLVPHPGRGRHAHPPRPCGLRRAQERVRARHGRLSGGWKKVSPPARRDQRRRQSRTESYERMTKPLPAAAPAARSATRLPPSPCSATTASAATASATAAAGTART